MSKESNLYDFKHGLSNALNMIKGFEVALTSRSDTQVIIIQNDKRFLVSFKEIDNSSDDIFKDIDKYL